MTFLLTLLLFLNAGIMSCDKDNSPPQQPEEETHQENEEPTNPTENMKLNITVGEHTLTATLANNSSVDALVALIQEAPLTIQMSDYGNMEKVGPIGQTLPRNDERINAQYGDIILYQGDKLVLYYASNSWSFTRIGKIDNVSQSELRTILKAGGDDVSVTFTLAD